MRCSNCGKKVSRRNSFCPHCGNPTIKEVVESKPKKPKQVFKIIMIILLIMLIIANIGVLVLINVIDLENINELFKNKEWVLLNVLTFFAPTMLIYLFVAVGWVVLFGVDIIGVLISLLTMIKASRKKKTILLVIIILFIILAAVNYFTRQV